MNEKEAAGLFASRGGKARAKKLSQNRRSEIARQGGKAKAARRRPADFAPDPAIKVRLAEIRRLLKTTKAELTEISDRVDTLEELTTNLSKAAKTDDRL